MDRSPLAVIYGVIALSPSEQGLGEQRHNLLQRIFAEGFHHPGDPSKSTVNDGLICCATHSLSSPAFIAAGRRPFVFWHTEQNRYWSDREADSLISDPEHQRACLEGRVVQAVDDCSLACDVSSQQIILRSSCAGASTFYYHFQEGCLLFSDSLARLKAARDAPLDPLGLSEIIRFGANYTRRTLLQGIYRLPFSHSLSCRPGETPVEQAYRNYAYNPDPYLTEQDVSQQVEDYIEENLSRIKGERELLFSGGVDSILLALYGVRSGHVSRGWFYAMGADDPEIRWARSAADIIGLDLKIIENTVTLESINQAIAAYSLPTLDFSIITTHALGAQVAKQRQGSTYIDGTGGDAWFGFGSLSHAELWNKLNHFQNASQPLASLLYSRLLQHEESPVIRPLKVISRLPVHKSAGLSHLCANPVYRQLLTLNQDKWGIIENDELALFQSLSQDELLSDKGEVILSDATMIAVAQFAAKSGQWSLGISNGTLYPYLMPNMVELGRHLPEHLIFNKGTAKPVLKKLVARSELGEAYAYRKKSGFQPPLQRMLEDPRSLPEVLGVFERSDETDPYWTDYARNLPRRLMGKGARLKIGGLYGLWCVYSIKVWLANLRAGTLMQ